MTESVVCNNVLYTKTNEKKTLQIWRDDDETKTKRERRR